MAENEKQEEEYVTTPFNAQLDLERRQEEGYKPDSVLGTVTVNPNPFGYEEYAGTDPIYQNHANDTEVPYAAEEGPEKVAEDNVKELYSLDDVDDDEVVEDYGLGGKARRAGNPNVTPNRYLVPGQEGYDLQKAQEQNGPPMRVEASDSGDKDDEGPELLEEAEFPDESISVPVNPSAPSQQGTDASSNQ